MNSQRIQELSQEMRQKEVDHQLISDPSSINYFIGYKTDPGERLLVLLVDQRGSARLYLNRLFPAYKSENDLVTVVEYGDGENIIQTLAQSLDGTRVGIDKTWPSHFLLELMDAKDDLVPLNQSKLVDDMRAIKSPEEIKVMEEASRLNDQACVLLISKLNEGLKESDMVHLLKDFYKQTGHSGVSFEPIVAYGPNGADPHHHTDDSTPQIGDSVVIDIGGSYQGYASDMTRTVFYGQASEEAQKVYQTVLRAQLTAIDTVKPGIPIKEIDLAARSVIDKAGYGDYFTHRTGHFIGQEAHEAGDVSQYNEGLTQVGQIFSIEPGIYLPGKFGVRIEDLILVTEDGHQVLNQISKDLIIIEPK